MADLQSLYRALEKADAAGDTQSAKQLADYIRGLSGPVSAPPPPPEGGFIPAVKRGFYQTGMLLGDVLPAMAARAIGADEYAEKQWKEAAATQEKIQREMPAAVPSYTDVKSLGDAWTYAKEAVGESIASLLPSIVTGGIAGVAGRGATIAAREAAERVLLAEAAKRGPPTKAAIDAATAAGVKAAQREALKYQAAGALTGSAAQNIPEVYQNIKEATGKEDLGAALAFGGFNAALDAVMPVTLLAKVRKAGIPEEQIMGAWYKRFAKGAGKGFLIEGGTEAAQETSSAAAEKFVDENQQFFSEKNFNRVVDAFLKGGIGGGVISGTTDVATGRKAPPKQFPGITTPPPPAGTTVQEEEEEAPPAPPAPAGAPAPAARSVSPDMSVEDLLKSLTGAKDAGEAITPPSGAGVQVAGEPGAKPAAEGAGTTVPGGVVPTVEDAGQPAGGEGAKPPPVKAEIPSVGPITGIEIPEILRKSQEDQQKRFNELTAARGTRELTPEEAEDYDLLEIAYALGELNDPTLSAPPPPSPPLKVEGAPPPVEGGAPAELKTRTTLGAARSEEETQKIARLQKVGERLGVIPQENEDFESYAARLKKTLAEVRGQSAPVAAPAPTSTESKAKTKALSEVRSLEKDIAAAYNQERDLAVYAGDDETLNFIEEAEKGRLPPSYTWGSQRLATLLEKNNISEPDFSDEYESKDAAGKAEEERSALNGILEQFYKKRNILEPWETLTVDQRDVYLGAVTANTPKEREKGLRALRAYTERVREAQGRPTDLKASPEAGIYERNRETYNRLTGIRFPNWAELTEQLRNSFRQRVLELGKARAVAKDPKLADKSERTHIKYAAADDQDIAFGEVARSLISDGKTLPPGVSAVDEQRRELKLFEEASKQIAQRRIAREREEKKKWQVPVAESGFGKPGVPTEPTGGQFLENFNRQLEKLRPTEVPAHVVEQIKKGNMAAVMQYLRMASPTSYFRVLAQRMYEIGVNSKIKFVDSLSDATRVAEYDPATDTIYVTTEGLKDKILLHEIVHATTVKVIGKYLAGKRSELTEAQWEAAEHLDQLMQEAKARPAIAKKYANAFEDLYEFVSYGLTDPEFQAALTGIRWEYKQRTAQEVIPSGKLVRGSKVTPKTKVAVTEGDIRVLDNETILPENRSLWTEFVQTVAALLRFPVFKKGVKIETKDQVIGSNVLLETLAAFEQILSPSVAGVELVSLPSKGAAGVTKKAPPKLDRTPEEIQKALPLAGKAERPTIAQALKSQGFWQGVVRKFQNAQEPLKRAQEKYDAFGKIIYTGDKINNVWSQATLATGRAWWNFVNRLAAKTNDVHKAIENFATVHKLTVDEALQVLHGYSIVMHEPERRRVKYIKTVPLEPAADAARKKILESLAHPTTKEADAVKYRQMLDKIVDDPNNHAKFIGPAGKAKPVTPEKAAILFDEKSEKYNVAGNYTTKELAEMRKFYTGTTSEFNQDMLKDVFDKLKEVQKETIELNKEANYWSQGVSNIVAFNGWKNYVPLKGRPDSKVDEELDPLKSRKIGGELQETERAFAGRESDSDNPVLQSLADGARAAMRLGRKDLTLSIKNAVNDGILKGDANTVIKFEDRANNPDALKEAQGEKIILHYEPNGDIRVVKLQSKLEAEAVRRTYREANTLLEKANAITSGIGQLHTRYSLPFAPMNFVRDLLTNAYTLGAELGPKASYQLIAEVSRQVATNGGLFKAGKIAYLMANNRVGEAKAMAAKDPYVADMLEYLEKGGRVSYIQGIAAKGQMQELLKDVGRNNVLKTKDQIEKVFDYWTDMFELASRTASYRVLKKNMMQEGKGKNLSGAELEDYASNRAAEYTKNLANFEQVGEWGKAMGAAFMFFRPAATGAVRALDAVLPAFTNYTNAQKKVTAELMKARGGAMKASAAEIDKAISDAYKKSSDARAMSAGLLGMGMAVYVMALMLSDDDDQERNKVATDDPVRWTRYARFFVPGMDNAIQIPWGFGLGAFAATGAQLASTIGGHTTPKEALSNVISIGLDSFLPLPFSRISPIDDPAAFLMDTATPSAFRPFLEFVMNKDGLGREIYNNRQSRAGDAYTGGDNIPEMYKQAARFLFDATNGGIDWSPNTMYFFANNYADGIMRGVSGVSSLAMSVTGYKEFDPKRDSIVFESFFGSPSNFDARQFSSVENQIKDIERRMNTLKSNNPAGYSDYLQNNPTHKYLVDYYNSQVNGRLRDIRKMMNDIRINREYTPKERGEMIDNLKPVQNLIKRNLLTAFEQISDLKP